MIMPYQMCNRAQQGLTPTIRSMLWYNHTLCHGSQMFIMVHQIPDYTPSTAEWETVSVCNMCNTRKTKLHPLKLSEQHISLDYAISGTSKGAPKHLELGTDVKSDHLGCLKSRGPEIPNI
ncbi:uncharacterized protein LOC126184474 [Schistocerca cancellata]|uniref:uncharacterized protein LOC126184473 n=1 Tax=Schistocerca cancellata TaxID=274614 RepID=UPI002117EF5E|nr:uncharacterized protein LOC126184473 [Schistocerca cancellata]XP_049782823.1 uncharacterized protein LOC126184474 [Schistocerca cancellata]